jgi:hypothetical protein
MNAKMGNPRMLHGYGFTAETAAVQTACMPFGAALAEQYRMTGYRKTGRGNPGALSMLIGLAHAIDQGPY